MTTAYLAARSEDQGLARLWRAALRSLGVDVISRWLDEDFAKTIAIGESAVREAAERDLIDIDAAEVFVILDSASMHRSGTGGRHVETGYALAKRKPLLVIGASENVFHIFAEVVPDTEPSVVASACHRIAEKSHAKV